MAPASGNTMKTLYHITSMTLMRKAELSGEYTPSEYAEEGFIHCWYLAQVVPVGNRRYRGHSDLVLLEIDPNLVDCDVIDENLEGGEELFPHIYGRLAWRAVTAVHEVPRDAQGGFSLPPTICDAID